MVRSYAVAPVFFEVRVISESFGGRQYLAARGGFANRQSPGTFLKLILKLQRESVCAKSYPRYHFENQSIRKRHGGGRRPELNPFLPFVTGRCWAG
jgi:hypothetical protein